MGREKRIGPGSTFRALNAIVGLKRGRSGGTETDSGRPIDNATVQATLPCLPQVVADMLRFRRLTGCRPSEVCIVRPADVVRSGKEWEYRPERHKAEHHGRQRVVFTDPKVQRFCCGYGGP
jgi:hypothetical protein